MEPSGRNRRQRVANAACPKRRTPKLVPPTARALVETSHSGTPCLVSRRKTPRPERYLSSEDE
jgi:hypothetical protein